MNSPIRLKTQKIFISARTFFAGAALVLSACGTPELCGDRVVWGPTGDHIELAKNDKLFVCGDDSYAAWKKIPPKQAEAFMRSYLESRGYLTPKIQIDFDAERVTVESGPRAIVTALISEGLVPPGWTTGPLETSLGKPLEKSTLDTIEQDALSLLMRMGYACADLTLRAHPDGRVVLVLKPGQPSVFPVAFNAQDFPIAGDILERFEPFTPGEPYNVEKTILAARRMEQSGVASSANYFTECDPESTDSKTAARLDLLKRNASFGPKRSWEIGAGVSTEEYPLAFIRWRNNRLWSAASQFRAELFGSNVRQNIGFDIKYFFSEEDRRLYLRPGFQVERRNERQFETIETKLSGFLGRDIDYQNWTLEPQVGLAVRRIRILDVAVPRTEVIATPEIQFGAHTHGYELYRASPRTGFDANLNYTFLPGSQSSSITHHRLFLQGTTLYNYKDYVDPRWVLGARFTVGTIFTSNATSPNPDIIPPDWLFLVGGDRNLRGFARNSLPPEIAGAPLEDQGAGSAATLGLESRWPGFFSFPLEPLIFTDFGLLGDGNARWTSDLHISPGFGARSSTPLGTVRATLARGIILNQNLRRWQLFFSFGTEF